MIRRDRYPFGVPCWVDTAQPDPVAAARFYRGVFGWDLGDLDRAGAGAFLMAKVDGADVAAIVPRSEALGFAITWRTYIAVDDADDVARRAAAAGGRVLLAPGDVGPAGRAAFIADPAGAELGLWQAGLHPGSALVNVAGTWNWSGLTTPDPDGAAAFYGAVFGWEARTMALGADMATMWCVPGYGDFLAELDPDLRRRHAEGSVPDGFSDAVAWMIATGGDGSPGNAPAQWSVTFAVDDTDAVATRATDLGGSVLTPPFDAGPARMAVIRDPQGATFTVSRYQPT